MVGLMQRHAQLDRPPQEECGVRSAEYRFLAIREPLRDPPLPGLGEQLALPFPTVEFCNRGRYKLTVVVTNRELSGEEVIERYRKRCGKSEQVHGLDPAYSL